MLKVAIGWNRELHFLVVKLSSFSGSIQNAGALITSAHAFAKNHRCVERIKANVQISSHLFWKSEVLPVVALPVVAFTRSSNCLLFEKTFNDVLKQHPITAVELINRSCNSVSQTTKLSAKAETKFLILSFPVVDPATVNKSQSYLMN